MERGGAELQGHVVEGWSPVRGVLGVDTVLVYRLLAVRERGSVGSNAVDRYHASVMAYEGILLDRDPLELGRLFFSLK